MQSIGNVATGSRLAVMFLLTLCSAVFIWGVGLSGAAPMATDTSISDAIEDELLLDRNIRAHLIDVTTSEGIVTLSGSVDNILAKQRARRIAEMVKGVRAVVNTITVLPPILMSDNETTFKYKDSRPDPELREDVTQVLRWDVLVDHALIDVDVKNGNVALSGTVGSLDEKMRAIGDAYVANVNSRPTQI